MGSTDGSVNMLLPVIKFRPSGAYLPMSRAVFEGYSRKQDHEQIADGRLLGSMSKEPVVGRDDLQKITTPMDFPSLRLS